MSMDLTRRQLLQRASIVGAFSALASNPALGQLMRAPRLIPWRNWSGGQSCLPAARIAPKNLDELTAVIQQAPGKIRPVGSAHSFSALVPTDGTLLSLSYFNGLLDHDPNTLQAEFAAGTPMSRMGKPLKDIGQALQNMADIDTFIGARAPFDPLNPTKNEVPSGSGTSGYYGWYKWLYARNSDRSES